MLVRFLVFAGGHRVPAFIGGPRVAKALSGQWYNGTVHLVDLHATLLDLGGAVPQQPAGTVPIDGVTLVPVLNGSLELSQPVRSELWIADDVLRVGDFKLITGQGTGASTCMVGIGGRPVAAANDPTDLNTTCGTGHCTGNETDPADQLICSGCKCPHYKPGPGCTPCLFNLAVDPGMDSAAACPWLARCFPLTLCAFAGETTNLADANPAKVASMTARILKLAEGTVQPDYPPSNMQAACEAMVAAGGFFVPWAEPPPPPPPPGPSVSAEALSGKWAMVNSNGQIGSIELTATGSPGGLQVSLAGTQCPGCCWKTGNGTSAPGPGGGTLQIVAYGPGCDTPRTCVGALAGGGPTAEPLQISWQSCRCHKPLRECGAFGTQWTKQ